MSDQTSNRFFRGEAWACFFLRMWIGMRLMFAGLTKWKYKTEEGTWAFDPSKGEGKMNAITDMMRSQTNIPESMLATYGTVLPYALVAVGGLVMLGLFTRISLFLAGGLVLSLSFGLMLLPDDVAAVQRGIEIIVIGLALMTVQHNVVAVDNLIQLGLSKDDEEDD